MSISISLCMIVKNEEETLEACLSSVKDIADEINIIDTGSTDNTVELSKRYTDRIFYFEWVGDFSKARNFSFSKATKDYIMWLDADDTITPENRQKILSLKETLGTDIKYVNMLYHYSHFEDGSPAVILSRERLVKREEGFKWSFPVHETLNVSGKFLDTDICITHTREDIDTPASIKRNAEILEKSVKDGANDIRTIAYLAVSLYKLGKPDEALLQIKRAMQYPYEERIQLSILNIYLAAHYIYLDKGDEKAALNVLLENESIMRDKSEYYCCLGAFYYNSENDTKKALECFQKALSCGGKEADGRFSTKNNEYYYFEPFRSIANCCIRLKQYDDALVFFKKALEYKPDDEAALNIVNKLEKLEELAK